LASRNALLFAHWSVQFSTVSFSSVVVYAPLGFYGLGAWHVGGCLPCHCSGHSTDCVSAPGWYQTSVSSQWNLVDGLTQDDQFWTAVDENGRNVSISYPTLVDQSQTS